MDGRGFPNKNMLAAVKTLKTVNSEIDRNQMADGWTEPVAQAGAKSNDLEALFQRHHDRVFRTAYRVTGSAADAEDVLQTVFLRLARGSEPISPENPDGYFARAAINASLDLLRARKRSKAVAIDDFESRSAPIELVSNRTPESNQQDRELRSLIREAVSKLGPTAGQMFALRYFEGYDNGEIGQMMNTSAIVVGVTLHRARTRLRKEIGSYLKGHREVV
jgi:RNA polymerase sigma-70 factor, ECF subfamily